ncbi:MAG TPA: S9 family peptidase [Acidimicrobiales bacterium]
MTSTDRVQPNRTQPPLAPRRPHVLSTHGKERVDDWYWLRDRDDPEVIAYLEAENEYAAAVLSPTEKLQHELFESIRSRVVETDAGAAIRHGAWWYFTRTFEGRQYPLLCRLPDINRSLDAERITQSTRSGTASGEAVLLDENDLATGDYMAVGVLDISPDHRLLAYAVDDDGSELYKLRFRDLDTGDDLADGIEGVYYGSAWSTDNSTFYYTRPDEAMRPFQVWRHRLGATGSNQDELVFEENDERFFVSVALTRTETRIVIHSSSSTTSEALWVDAADPNGDATIILPREDGVEYDVEHDGDSWLVRTNRAAADGSPRTNFALFRLQESSHDPAELEEVISHRADVTLESADAFAAHIVVWERHQADGLERLRIMPRSGTGQHIVEQAEPVYTLSPESNPEWDSTSYRFGYTSLAVPASSIEYDLTTRQRRAVWTQLVRGFDTAAYRTERLWAKAPDGTLVPISLVAPKDALLDGSAPCFLYGYGAYQVPVDPSFSPVRANLMERGVTFAIAHVRGGGDLGRSWYETGRLEHKANTFSDFIAAATFLIDSGWVDQAKLVARGGSAGGLLMGAVTNTRPDLWRAIVAEVPFVDVVTTMCDPSLPLTVTEWDEWGDPLHDEAAYDRMLSYSPYDNVEPKDYPAMFVTAGLNDPRVGFWEPAKWVAKLRSVGAGKGDRPILLRTEMGAGHRGSTGRYHTWRDEARIQAFMLWQMGLA